MTKATEMLNLANVLADECSALSTDSNMLRVIMSKEERNEIVSALRLAAQSVGEPPTSQQPVAWVIPGDDNAKDNGFIDAMAWQEGEFTRPLYAAPTQNQRDKEILSLVRVWRECPAERRPSAAALADRIIETLSLSSTPRATPIDHSNEECPNFPGCHCVDQCCDGWKHPSPEISSTDQGGK